MINQFNRILIVLCVLSFLISCQDTNNHTADTNVSSESMQYTCPMPEDSVFSDQPGKCPKCGMDLVPISDVQTDTLHHTVHLSGYTCPMHPQIYEDKPGSCPICGMDLEMINKDEKPLALSLEMLLQPTNQAVVANVPMVHMAQRKVDMANEVIGTIEFDPKSHKRISARFGGRITKMYVKYRYQPIKIGQPIMEVYSQEIVAAQNHYLFLLRQDAGNSSLISAAKKQLILLGMSEKEIGNITKSGRALQSITIYSNGTGLADEPSVADRLPEQSSGIAPLSLKEGNYISKGQPLFLLINPAEARVALQIYPSSQNLLKVGDKVRIQPEANPDHDFRASIKEIVPYYQSESKTLIARVPFDNSRMKLPAGSTVKALIFPEQKDADWLPEEAVTSMGLDQVVFVREEGGFVARKVKTGITSRHLVQIIEGLKPTEAVAANAGFLVDSESFIVTQNDQQ